MTQECACNVSQLQPQNRGICFSSYTGSYYESLNIISGNNIWKNNNLILLDAKKDDHHLISMYLFRLIQIVNLWYALYGMRKLTRSMICAHDRPVRSRKEQHTRCAKN
jgi:hypothetical protein